MNIKFSGKGLAFLSHYMAKHDIRYYLNGINLRPLPAEAGGGVVGSASNGHILGMWHDQDGHVDREVTIRVTPGLVRACARKAPKRLPAEPMLTLVNGRLACTIEDTEVYIQPNEYRAPDPTGKPFNREPWEIDGKFPHIGRVVPQLGELAQGPMDCINHTYLALISKSLPNSGKWGSGIQMFQTHKGGSVLVLSMCCTEAAIIVMPMRDEITAPPTWLQRFKACEQRMHDATTAPLPVHEPSDAGPKDGDRRGWDMAKGGNHAHP